MLGKPTLQQVFDRAAYRQWLLENLPQRAAEFGDCEFRVFRERTFAMRQGERLLSGAIDRLVLQQVNSRTIGAEVIDFKTDDISTAGLYEERVEMYRPQLAAYCDAVARLYNLPRRTVTARLVFVNGDKSTLLS